MASSSMRLLLCFGSLSLAAILTGAGVALANEAPALLVTRNLIGWAVGALAAAGLARIARAGAVEWLVWLAPLAVGASFLFPDLQGVHRWIGLGLFRLNAALLVLPVAVVAFAVGSRRGWLSWVPILTALALLVWQPDASQATALTAVVVVAAVRLRDRWFIALAVIAAAIVAAADAWIQPDPLPPIPEVEGILTLAQAISPILGLLLIGLLGLTALAPAALTLRAPTARFAGLGLSLLFLAWVVTPFFGAFPVPFAGIGPSPILGAWLGVGLLAALIDSPPLADRPFKTVSRTASSRKADPT